MSQNCLFIHACVFQCIMTAQFKSWLCHERLQQTLSVFFSVVSLSVWGSLTTFGERFWETCMKTCFLKEKGWVLHPLPNPPKRFDSRLHFSSWHHTHTKPRLTIPQWEYFDLSYLSFLLKPSPQGLNLSVFFTGWEKQTQGRPLGFLQGTDLQDRILKPWENSKFRHLSSLEQLSQNTDGMAWPFRIQFHRRESPSPGCVCVCVCVCVLGVGLGGKGRKWKFACFSSHTLPFLHLGKKGWREWKEPRQNILEWPRLEVGPQQGSHHQATLCVCHLQRCSGF